MPCSIGTIIKNKNANVTWVRCSACPKWFHQFCVDVSDDDLTFKTSYVRECTRMYQVDFQDFSEFGVDAYLSSPDQYILKNIHLRLWVAMVDRS